MSKYASYLLVALSLAVLAVASYEMSIMESFMNTALEQSGSSLTTASLDEGAVGTLRMYLGGTILHGIWFAIFGLFTAWGVRKREDLAWKLGILWGILLLIHGISAIAYTLYILNWTTLCPLSITTLLAGILSLIVLIVPFQVLLNLRYACMQKGVNDRCAFPQ